ncbi:TetR/AcrR family transcriptional regulator [Vibrio penaeicida]|uniref:TetR/AcrR family transcriptional regulator n=1 Tax=Vibrio penaeicida TaxID=104609 RepID=UPI002736E092|nr:TetR/AcrR family transcriptional regulator [Vibrio penaeicida]MDP2575282.1 TetR/AcrR family transcriptional regulator [Vibrio penaeicida]
MAKKKYSIEEVISQATDLFWSQGYSATSIQHISKKTGLKPGSLYNEFGSKEGVFRMALESYANHSVEEIHTAVQKTGSAIKGIQHILIELIEQTEESPYCGCFLVKSQLELSALDDDLQFLATDKLQVIEQTYCHHLESTFSTSEAQNYAHQLMMVIFGIRVYGYQKNASEVLTDNIQRFLPWLTEAKSGM